MIYDFTKDVKDFINGDEEAFYRIYEHSYLLIKKRVQKYIKNPVDVEDLLQDIYLKMYQKLNTIKSPEKFISWIYTLCRFSCIDWLNQQKIERNRIDFIPDYSDDVGENGLDQLNISEYKKEYNPEAYIEAAETKRLIDEIMEDLPEKQRVVLLLWKEQMKYEEIAESLDMPLGSVKTNCSRAKKAVEAKIRDLEKHGTKLYSMAPFIFFLWLLDQYDLLYIPDIPANEVEAFYNKLQLKINQLPSSAKSGISTDGLTEAKTGITFSKVGIRKVIAGILGIAVVGTGIGTAIAYPQIKKAQTTSTQVEIMPIHVKIPEIQTAADGSAEVTPEVSGQPTETSTESSNSQSESPKGSQNQPQNNQTAVSEKKNSNVQNNSNANTNTNTSTACSHNWVEQGHYETQVVKAAYDEDVYATKVVCGCGAQFDNDNQWEQHSIDGCPYGYSVKNVKVGTKHHDAVTKQVWVATGYTCSKCGATK